MTIYNNIISLMNLKTAVPSMGKGKNIPHIDGEMVFKNLV